MPEGTPPFRAVIFDMDGVLTDSEPAFHAAANDVLARYGLHVTLDEWLPGISTVEMWTRVIAMQSVPATVDQLVGAYEAPLMRRLREPRPPLPNARALLDTLRTRGVPIGLCTASYMRWVEPILAGAGLTGMFDVISTPDMVERTKPDPAPYGLAAQMLGFAASECIAVEDSAAGIVSALAAGAHVIQLRATETSAPPQPGVALVISSLKEFPLELTDISTPLPFREWAGG